jgi:hypothetical protein
MSTRAENPAVNVQAKGGIFDDATVRATDSPEDAADSFVGQP